MPSLKSGRTLPWSAQKQAVPRDHLRESFFEVLQPGGRNMVVRSPLGNPPLTEPCFGAYHLWSAERADYVLCVHAFEYRTLNAIGQAIYTINSLDC